MSTEEKRAARANYGGFGVERQSEIYLSGQGGGRPVIPIDYSELVAAAKSRLSKEAFDYIEGGAGTEETIRGNETAFSRWGLVPRTLTDVSERDTRIEILGKTIPAPLFLAPVGAMSLVHPKAEIDVALASEFLGIPFILSTLSSYSIEEVSKASPNVTKWFQFYYGKDHDVNASLVSRAEAAGYSAIVVTPDTRLLAWRVRDMQNAFLPFLGGVGLANYFSDPVFKKKLGSLDNPQEVASKAVRNIFDPAFSWKDISRLKEQTRLPIIIKGILDPRDAIKAVELGVDAIVVSTHGGRQIDGSISSLEALPEIVKVVEGQIPVLFDSGIRNGSQVVKALALGAKAVFLGRPYVWGVALAGRQGCAEVIENLLADFDLTLGLLGCNSVKELNASFVRKVD